MTEIAPGYQLGIYKLLSKLGAGGMGEVWRGEDTRLGREVAIKILPREMSSDEESKARLMREARTAAQLNHPNIAMIHAVDHVDDQWFIVMELVDGRPLSAEIRSRRLSESAVCRIAKGVASALAAAHDKSIVHRDIKPDNVLVSGERVKVLDFGIAKRVGPPGAGSATFVTQAGIVLRTVHYMSPEQALGKQLDGRSDIYSLGVVMFEAVTGLLPFRGDTVTDVLTQIIRDDPPKVSSLNHLVSPKLAAIIETCLRKKPVDRFQNAGELIRAIEDAEQFIATTQEPTALLPTAVIDETGSRRLVTVRTGEATPAPAMRWALAALAVVLLVVVGLLAMRLGKRPAVKSPPGAKVVEISSQPAATTNPEPAAVSTVPNAPETVAAVPAAIRIEEKEPSPEAVGEQPTEQAALEPRAATTGEAEARDDRMPPPPPGMPPHGTPPPRDDAPIPAGATVAQLYEEGIQAIRNDNPKLAMLRFGQVVRLDPNHAKAHLRIGEMVLVRGERLMAAHEFDKALAHRESLDEREVSIARIGLAASRGDRPLAERLILEHKSRYPDDRELATLTRALTGPQPFRKPRRPGPNR